MLVPVKLYFTAHPGSTSRTKLIKGRKRLLNLILFDLTVKRSFGNPQIARGVLSFVVVLAQSPQDHFFFFFLEGKRIVVLLVNNIFDCFLLRSEEHTSELQSRENLVC